MAQNVCMCVCACACEAGGAVKPVAYFYQDPMAPTYC